MSNDVRLQLGGGPDDGFTIKSIHGCRIVYGAIPASELGMLTHGYSKKAQMAIDIADRIGAAFVVGELAALDELRQMDLPVSDKRQRDYEAAFRLGLHDAAIWLRTGERGGSSNAMCKRLFGVPSGAETAHPHDPDDLHRCILFLDAVKAHDKVSLMADVSPEWNRMVSAWDRLVDAYNKEVKVGKSAPKTYAVMCEVLGNYDLSGSKKTALAVIQAARLAVALIEKANPNFPLHKEQPQTTLDVLWEHHLLRGTAPSDSAIAAASLRD